MKLVMFSPKGAHLERGWPGRIEGDRVIQLAAQTLQSFFTGSGQAREHAEHPLEDVELRAPVCTRAVGAVRDFYAFEQHVKTARANRGLEVPRSGTSSRSSLLLEPYRDLRAGAAGAVSRGHESELDYELESPRSSASTARSAASR